MSNKSFLFTASVIINFILGYLFLSSPDIDELESINKALKDSEARIHAIELQDSIIQSEIDSINHVKHLLEDSLEKKVKQRVIIKKEYYEKMDSIISLNADSSVSYISRRLSSVRID
jgi:hypothetical protein